MEPGMFDGLLAKGALMAIGAGGATAFLGLIGWVLVQFILAKYGKKKNGNDKSAPPPAPTNEQPRPYPDHVTTATCTAHHEEVKDLIRAEFKEIDTRMQASLSRIYTRIHEHVSDYNAHRGGP